MSFLGFGKKEKKELPPLKFPEFSIPKYEPLIPPIRKEPSFSIPEIPRREPFANNEPLLKTQPLTPIPSTKKNVFVKIEKYKTSMKLMNDIKAKLNDIQEIIEKLNKIKQQEDQELNLWETNLLEIKDKLEAVDRNLFS